MARRREATPMWIGIDVAKRAIDVARGPGGQLERVERALEPLQQWARTIPRQARVVLEATGGLERIVTTVLRARSIAVCVLNPRQVRDGSRRRRANWRRPTGWMRGCSRIRGALGPRVTVAQATDVDALRALLDRRRQLVETRTAEKNRRHTAPEAVIGSIDDHIAWLDEQIERLDRTIEEAATACTALAEPLERLRAIPGVGRVVGLTVLTHLPEIGTLDRKTDRGLRRARPVCLRERPAAGSARDLGRARRCPGHALSRGAVRRALECAATGFLRALGRPRKVQESRARRRRPQAADRHQRHDARPASMATGGRRRTQLLLVLSART
jgi:transposase